MQQLIRPLQPGNLSFRLRIVPVQQSYRAYGAKTSIRELVRVKTTDCSDSYGYSYVAGSICRKNVIHKSMKRRIENPRVLLMSGGIEYERTATKLSSLDTLLEQEKDYMSILVSKIQFREVKDSLFWNERRSNKSVPKWICHPHFDWLKKDFMFLHITIRN